MIALIQQAITRGQVQPWMYEVLAISLELAGRPKSEVERALTSSPDFSSTDVPALIYLASYLERYDLTERALKFYEQAAKLEPQRPDAYLLALKLAQRKKVWSAVAWAAPGVLTYAWGPGHPSQHQLAERAAAEALKGLQAAGQTQAAEELQRNLAEARHRDLTVRVEWSGHGDIDLSVEEPGGSVCSSETPKTSGGGIYLHDGFGPRAENCYEEYLCPVGWTGEYRLKVRHSWGTIVGKRALVKITRHAGTARQNVTSQTVVLGDEEQTIVVSLKEGRRQEEQGVVVPTTDRRRKTFGNFTAQQINAQVPLPQGGLPASGGAVGFQPQTTVLSEGVTMSAMAVISGDRRYVRLTLNPALTAVNDVFNFSFVNGQ